MDRRASPRGQRGAGRSGIPRGGHPIVTLLTDFGNRDPFAGIMKGVILDLCPEAAVVDLSHEADAYDILGASFLLQSAVGFFPRETIHVAVVDPGVGGRRRPILASINDQLFVAPDNGLLSYPMAYGTVQVVRALTASEFFLHPVSATFHGRDVFAPVAGHLARGVPPERFGPELADAVRLHIPRPSRHADGTLVGQVILIDRFGNCITDIGREDLKRFMAEAPGVVRIAVGGRTLNGLVQFFGEVGPGGHGAILGSTGHLELFAYHGNLAREWGIASGAPVRLIREG